MENSQLFEFSRGVCYYIADPDTWRNFALTCTLFASVSREYVPLKKNEFRLTIRQWMKKFTTREPIYIHINLPSQFDKPLVLPNGALHGSLKTGIDGNDNQGVGHIAEINTGLSQFIYSCEFKQGVYLQQPETYMFVKHVLIIENPFTVTFCNLNSNTFISGYKCGLCNKVHSFLVAGSPIRYSRTCLESSYSMATGSTLQFTRTRIAKKIILYAKLLKKHAID